MSATTIPIRTKRSVSHGCRWSGLVGIALAPFALGAEIRGQVNDAVGSPLYKAPVCLRVSSNAPDCLKLRFSDRKGKYAFKGLKSGAYTVSIFLDKSASARKAETFKTYVWTGSQNTLIERKNETVQLTPFVGKFNYSNYQRVIALGASDFPELAQQDLVAQPVFLKVSFESSGSPEAPPETIFLGQVTDPDNLRLEASVPLAVTGIDYEIFSALFSYSGRISLAD